MNTEKNLRYKETDDKIKECVLSLLEEKHLKDITVKEVCQITGINRSSFYIHFADVYAAAEAIMSEKMSELTGGFKRVVESDEQYDPLEYLRVSFTHMRENMAFYDVYFNEIGIEQQRRGAEFIFKEVILPYLTGKGIPENKATYQFEFLQSGIMAVARLWLKNGCKESPEELIGTISDYLDKL